MEHWLCGRGFFLNNIAIDYGIYHGPHGEISRLGLGTTSEFRWWREGGSRDDFLLCGVAFTLLNILCAAPGLGTRFARGVFVFVCVRQDSIGCLLGRWPMSPFTAWRSAANMKEASAERQSAALL